MRVVPLTCSSTGIVCALGSAEKVYARECWKDLLALRERRVHCVPEAYLGRPGPGPVEGHRDLRRICEEIQ